MIKDFSSSLPQCTTIFVQIQKKKTISTWPQGIFILIIFGVFWAAVLMHYRGLSPQVGWVSDGVGTPLRLKIPLLYPKALEVPWGARSTAKSLNWVKQAGLNQKNTFKMRSLLKIVIKAPKNWWSLLHCVVCSRATPFFFPSHFSAHLFFGNCWGMYKLAWKGFGPGKSSSVIIRAFYKIM